jgi:outer membrane protein
MINKRILLFLLFTGSFAFGQEAVLDRYIEEGLRENLALRQKEFSYERSTAALKEARGMFMPSLGLEARYTRAGGGRIIDVPIGDLVNPGFRALNTLLQSFGQPAAFPTNLPNERIPFLREREQQTEFRVIQPVFQPALYYNYKIRSALRDIESLSRDSYARQLIADIQTAYYNFLKTEQVVLLLCRTDSLVSEHVRVAESLYRNGKATRADTYRAKADLYECRQNQAEGEKNRDLAASYFNFLLNHPLDSRIEKPEASLPIRETPWTEEYAESLAVSRREELRQLDRAVDLSGCKVAASRIAFLPGVAAVLEWGYWDEEYRFNSGNDFWTATVVARWNLFNGFQDKYKTDQAKLERRERQSEREAVRSQIRIQAHDAWEGVRVAAKSLAAARERLTAAQKSFELVDRMYGEGMAPQIELLNARNSMTQAEVGAAVCEYDCRIRFAELEKVTAMRPIRTGER